MNPYEVMLMIEPEVAEERHGEIIDRVKQTADKAGGTWISVDPWGKRRLAYEIKHQAEAWYYVLSFDAPAEALHEITRVLAITDGVMRFMAVNRIADGKAGKPAESREEEKPVEAGG